MLNMLKQRMIDRSTGFYAIGSCAGCRAAYGEIMSKLLRLTASAAVLFSAGLLPANPAQAQSGAPYYGPIAAAPNAPIPAPNDPGKAFPGEIVLAVDARDVARGIFRVQQSVPVAQAGPFTLLFPEWLPGNHGPRGPIDKLAGLIIQANGKTLPWRRDPVNVYAFHVEVPAGVTALDVRFQYLSPVQGAQGRIVATPAMLNLQWNATVLYPAGYYADKIAIRPSVTLPPGWGYAGALEEESRIGDVVRFKRTELETLVDSPLFAGKYFKSIDLDPGAKVPVRLNLFGDRPELIEAKPEQIDAHKRLVQQAYLLYGPGHFDRYDFLLAMSERMGGIGLEHHRSSENAAGATYFTEWDKQADARDLLPHEMTHSWNGKYRRPADLWTPNYDVPMRDSLLWLYEGQTQFWGEVLAARSGLWTTQQALDQLALTAATYSYRTGKQWRPLVDTTNQPIMSARTPQPWRSWQRPEDYYAESQLIWLEADQIIRGMSGGKRSMDDFARGFFGGGGTGARQPVVYTYEDIVKTLNAVQPYDWDGFLKARVLSVAPNAPLDGLKRGGWQLVFGPEPSELAKSIEGANKVATFLYSLGFTVGEGARLTEVLWDSPAFQQNLTIGAQILAVNGVNYDADGLKRAIKAAQAGDGAIALLVKEEDRYRTVNFDYKGGLRYPRLERIAGAADTLSALYAPRKAPR